jgi:hypothetical protein
MSHFTVLVIGDNPEGQLAPFQYHNNPDSRWDWCVLGGRWYGYFKLKKGKTGKLGEPGASRNKPRYDVDSALKGDIDLRFLMPTYAILKDGDWQEQYTMGEWESPEVWGKEFKEFISNLPDDTLLSAYDCHI